MYFVINNALLYIDYSIQREHSGLKRILGYGLTITRGAASAMMFTYSTLLITMCHNTITVLRTTILQFYIPFDSAMEMHKYIACWALFFTGEDIKLFNLSLNNVKNICQQLNYSLLQERERIF